MAAQHSAGAALIDGVAARSSSACDHYEHAVHTPPTPLPHLPTLSAHLVQLHRELDHAVRLKGEGKVHEVVHLILSRTATGSSAR